MPDTSYYENWPGPNSISRLCFNRNGTSILKELPNATLLLFLRNIAVHRNNFFRCLSVRLCVCPVVTLLDVIFTPFHQYVLQVLHAFLWMPPLCYVYLYLLRFSVHKVKYRYHKQINDILIARGTISIGWTIAVLLWRVKLQRWLDR